MNPFLIKLLQKTQGDKASKLGQTPEFPRSWYFLVGAVLVILITVIVMETLKQQHATP